MKNLESSADSYICHVADAPQPQQHVQRDTNTVALQGDAYYFHQSTESVSHRYSSPRASRETSASALPGVREPEKQQPEKCNLGALDAQPPAAPSGVNVENTAAMLATLLAAENHAPSSSVPREQAIGACGDAFSANPADKNSDKNSNLPTLAGRATSTAADTNPFISASTTDIAADDVPCRQDLTAPTLKHGPHSKFPTKEAMDAEVLLNCMPQPEEDRVRGYSVMHMRSPKDEHCLTDEQKNELAQQLPPIARTAEHRSGAEGAASDGASSKNIETVLHIAKNSSALDTAENPNTSIPATYTSECSMRELVSHVDSDSFGFDLRSSLQAIDFAAVLDEYRQNCSVESSELQDCRYLFRVVSKGKDALSADDVYNLLMLFTPCGVALREGVDFLRENCEGKSSLSFENFLVYGPRLRARLCGYELFSQLTDHEKLLATHRRVLPNEPLVDANAARVGLLQLSREQLRGVLRQQTRALRLYEQVFLAEYQEKLYEAALIPASEVPQRIPGGDLAHEQNYTLPRLSVPVMRKGNASCRPGGGEHSRSQGRNDKRPSAVSSLPAAKRSCAAPHNDRGESSRISPAHRDATHSGRGLQPTQGQGRLSGRGSSNSKKGSSTARMAGTLYSLYNSTGPRSARKGESLAVTLPSRPRTDTRRVVGRFLEEEYLERRTLDDYLLTQLQDMYITQ
ncbi:hypothetical protein ABL78_4974 [Leptomonas seymouri]|uniref:Uncharacterized protein n=1 Tax=Leptomonas seymouri TaxID=5684 RepID=A0A0N1I5M1_LEPSE|nr:hypothetical protein ABL78_4974 [Leptomonas seymouri]|eukprot:KPI85972.1 hypothetical protein ABL78_4974 [Leptomonas seymouri]